MPERDEASEFFFVNRARIHAWAGLRAQARDSLDGRLLALDGAVLGLARALGAGWRHGGLGASDAHRRLGLR